MASTSFTLFVLYGQIAIFLSSLQQPFNDWLQKHVDQGFSWRQGSAAFRTLEESGQHLIELEVLKQPKVVSEEAVRVIEVPFEVVGDDTIEIASISESIPLKLSVGLYSLRCELFAKDGDGNFPVRIIFTHSEFPEFNVVRADNGLAIQGDLLTDANPA